MRIKNEALFFIVFAVGMVGLVFFSRWSVHSFEVLIREQIAAHHNGIFSHEDLQRPIKEYARNIFVASEFVIFLFLAGGIALYRQRQANFDLAVEAKAAREWRQTFDAITDLVSIHESDFRVLRVNKAMADTFGKKPEELVGMSCFELVHGAHGPIDQCPHKKTLATGVAAQEEFFDPHLGRWLEVSTSPITDEKGRVVRTVHVAKDITARKKSEEKMLRLSRLLDDVIQKAPLGMYVVGQDGRVEYANQAMLHITGATMDESKRLNVFTYPPYVKLGLSDKIRGALSGEPFRLENLTFESLFSGRVTSQTIAGVPMPGESPKALIIAEDITYKKEIEKMKRLSELGKFVGDAAHFIDNPLMVIMGSAEMSMMEGVGPDEVKENLKVVVRECERAKNIIRSLREFVDPGKHDSAPVDIHQLLDDMIAGLRLPWQQAGIEFHVSWGKGLPRALINTGQIKRAFLQILLNAKEAMPRGGSLEIKTSREGAFIRVDIKDSGAGMNAKVLEHIFDPFFTTAAGKSGLGVSVAYGILREQGGDLKYVSEPGKGTLASVFLSAV